MIASMAFHILFFLSFVLEMGHDNDTLSMHDMMKVCLF